MSCLAHGGKLQTLSAAIITSLFDRASDYDFQSFLTFCISRGGEQKDNQSIPESMSCFPDPMSHVSQSSYGQGPQDMNHRVQRRREEDTTAVVLCTIFFRWNFLSILRNKSKYPFYLTFSVDHRSLFCIPAVISIRKLLSIHSVYIFLH